MNRPAWAEGRTSLLRDEVLELAESLVGVRVRETAYVERYQVFAFRAHRGAPLEMLIGTGDLREPIPGGATPLWWGESRRARNP